MVRAGEREAPRSPCGTTSPGRRGTSAPEPAAVYRALAPAVLGYLRARGAREPEDLLGEVFLQVARDLGRFEGDDAALRRWVFSIAHNRLIDEGRRRERRPRTVGPEHLPDHAAADDPEPSDPELLAALANLTSEQQEVLTLRFVADLPIEQVAGIMRRRVGAVKALQHRALENLRRAVSRED
jgi:RNA polymerase sigma-70 factor (ECF subfamily)